MNQSGFLGKMTVMLHCFKSFFVIVLFVTNIGLFADKPLWQQAYDRVGESLVGKSCSAVWEPVDIIFHGMKKASQEYQQLGEHAQQKVGVSEGSYFPVYHGEKTETRTHGIMVDEKDLQDVPYAVKQAVMYQQAVHRKYNDAGMVELASFSGMMPIMAKVHQYMPAVRGKFLIALGICMACDMTFRSMIEKPLARRAALEGLEALDCSRCIDQAAQNQKFMQRSHMQQADIDHLKKGVSGCRCDQHKVS